MNWYGFGLNQGSVQALKIPIIASSGANNLKEISHLMRQILMQSLLEVLYTLVD